MARCSRKVWFGGVIIAFLTMSVTAAPPVINDHNRMYGNSVGGGSCRDIPGGQSCVDIQAWENYDVKGTFQFTEVVVNTNFHRVFSDGSWRQGWRYLTCPVDQTAISALPNWVALEATLDPEAPGCFSDGQIETWDESNGYQSNPWGFAGPSEISGEWLDPMNYANSTTNRLDKIHDGWSDTTNTVVRHCDESWADMMNDGGFSHNQRFFPFEGFDGPAWSHFQTMSCNENNKQR